MKKVLLVLTVSLFLASCGTSPQEENVVNNVTDTTTVDTTTTESVEDTASLN